MTSFLYYLFLCLRIGNDPSMSKHRYLQQGISHIAKLKHFCVFNNNKMQNFPNKEKSYAKLTLSTLSRQCCPAAFNPPPLGRCHSSATSPSIRRGLLPPQAKFESAATVVQQVTFYSMWLKVCCSHLNHLSRGDFVIYPFPQKYKIKGRNGFRKKNA